MPVFNINGEGFSLSAEGAEVSQVFLKPVFAGDNILDTFRVMRTVKRRARMWHLGKPSRILQKNTGCGWNAQGSFSLTPREIEVDRVKINVEQCNDEFWDTEIEELLGDELDIDNLGATEAGRRFIDAIMSMLTIATQDDIHNVAFLNLYDNEGATSTPSWYNGGSSGVIDEAGVLQKIEDGVADGDIVQVQNSGADFSGSAMTGALAYAAFSGMMEAQSPQLRGAPKSSKRFWATPSMVDAYVKYMEGLGTDESFRLIMDGKEQIVFRGIPIIEQVGIQEELEKPTADGGFGLPNVHRCILGVAGSLVVATDILSSSNRIKVWYDDEKEEKWFYKAKFKLGFDYAHPEVLVYLK